MNTKKEMTAPITSVGADEEQSNSIKTNTIITDYDENCNASDDIFQEMQEEFQRHFRYGKPHVSKPGRLP